MESDFPNLAYKWEGEDDTQFQIYNGEVFEEFEFIEERRTRVVTYHIISKY